MNVVDGDENSYWQICANCPRFHPAGCLRRAHADRLQPVNCGRDRANADGLGNRVSADRRSCLLQKMTDARLWQEDEERPFDVDASTDIIGVKLVIIATRAKSCMRLYQSFGRFLRRPPDDERCHTRTTGIAAGKTQYPCVSGQRL